MRSAPVAVDVQPSSPGLFTSSGNGRGGVAALNGDGSVNSEQRPAAKGGIVSLFGAGAGIMDPPLDDGALVAGADHHARQPIQVRIGGVTAEVLYQGGAPTLVAGVRQINVRVPATVSGGLVPVELQSGNSRSRKDVYLYIQ